MKKLFYSLFILSTLLCFIACKPEAGDETGSTPEDTTPPAANPGSKAPGSGNKEPQVDATTLDGWYVKTRDSAGQKLNEYTAYINDNALFVYYSAISYKDGEVLFEYDNEMPDEYTITLDPNNNLSFVDDLDSKWEMTTDSKGTWLRNIDDPDCYGDFQKVTGPEKTGIGVGSVEFYIKNNDCLCFDPENENKYYLGNISIDGAGLSTLVKDSETAFHEQDNFFSITINGNTLTVSDSNDDNIPDGDYTLYTRSTPWPTYTPN